MVLPGVRVKELRRTYGFEEVAIVPGDVTTNPELSVTQLVIGPYQFSIPIIASAMDAIVNPAFAGLMANAGGLGVMNLEGLYCRYEDPARRPAADSVRAERGRYGCPSARLHRRIQ